MEIFLKKFSLKNLNLGAPFVLANFNFKTTLLLKECPIFGNTVLPALQKNVLKCLLRQGND